MLNRTSWPVMVSAACLILAGLAVFMHVPALLSAVAGPGIPEQSANAALASLLEEHADKSEMDTKRFNGRSFFFKPPPPPPPPRARPKPRPTPVATPRPVVPETPREPDAPANYQGPSIIAILGDSVWFKPTRSSEKSLIIALGEEKEGVKVLEVSPPWKVKLGHQRGEYDVNVFDFVTESSSFFATAGSVDREPITDVKTLTGTGTGTSSRPSETADNDRDRSSRSSRVGANNGRPMRPVRGRTTARPSSRRSDKNRVNPEDDDTPPGPE